ncbi:helix-turn-helix transcriptional regulator [Oscillibacter sp.]|uniref:helix-turn-helix transcriptional regulator n=1 Tax=Oscillibacter sp. TaxID=1945593 RepID=UPI0028989DE0|nr:helix-turn-helix transcriptional regulator [Oscillibacter sp.]
MKNKVREIRERHGLTQRQLAILSEVGRSTISNTETGRYIPRVDVAIRIARQLHTPVERLFFVGKVERK